MQAYKKYVTIKESRKLELTDLPFRPGQRVEVVVIAEDEKAEGRLEELRALFRETQSLPQVKSLSDETIAEEIEKYRAGR